METTGKRRHDLPELEERQAASSRAVESVDVEITSPLKSVLSEARVGIGFGSALSYMGDNWRLRSGLSRDPTAPARCRVLLVESRQSSRQVLERRLRATGYLVQSVATCAEAYAGSADRFDVAVVAISETTDVEVAHRLLADARIRRLVLLVGPSESARFLSVIEALAD